MQIKIQKLVQISGTEAMRTQLKPSKPKRAITNITNSQNTKRTGGRTGLMVRASDSGSGDPGSILGRVGVLFP